MEVMVVAKSKLLVKKLAARLKFWMGISKKSQESDPTDLKYLNWTNSWFLYLASRTLGC